MGTSFLTHSDKKKLEQDAWIGIHLKEVEMETGGKLKPRLSLVSLKSSLGDKICPTWIKHSALEAAGVSSVNMSFLEARLSVYNAPSPPGTWLMLI